jgi:8-oxo-dGTP pyrophosphatase MutT (NUDIX family)
MPDAEHTITYESAGGIVVDRTGDLVLLLIRPSRDEVRLPKGHIEPGESSEAAALRETREESGYGDLKIVADLGVQLVTFLLDGNIVRRDEHYFLMQAESQSRAERPADDEAQFIAVWVPWGELQEHLTFEAEREWARRAQIAWKNRG